MSVVRGDLRIQLALDVPAGSVLVIEGANGAGKTTLLATLAGHIAASEGRVQLGATVMEDVARGVRLPTQARRVGVCYQDRRLFPSLTARDNVAYGARSRGIDRKAARDAADSWLERLGMASLAALRPARLSAGQAQRVALARALACSPRWLLLDEPLAALDPDARAQTLDVLVAALQDFDGPVLLVSHERDVAQRLSAGCVRMERGRLVSVDPALDHRARNVRMSDDREQDDPVRDDRVRGVDEGKDGDNGL